MLNIVLFGPPGAGKGTQSEMIIRRYNLQHLSTGDILRDAIEKKTKLGMEAKMYMDKGELVPDSVVIGIIGRILDENRDKAGGFVFDGFPRTTVQAEELDKMLAKKGLSISQLLALEVEYQELVDRLLKRGQISGRSDDRNIDVIKNRINVYNDNTRSVMDYYRAQGKYSGINGMGTIEEIFERICKAMDALPK